MGCHKENEEVSFVSKQFPLPAKIYTYNFFHGYNKEMSAYHHQESGPIKSKAIPSKHSVSMLSQGTHLFDLAHRATKMMTTKKQAHQRETATEMMHSRLLRPSSRSVHSPLLVLDKNDTPTRSLSCKP